MTCVNWNQCSHRKSATHHAWNISRRSTTLSRMKQTFCYALCGYWICSCKKPMIEWKLIAHQYQSICFPLVYSCFTFMTGTLTHFVFFCLFVFIGLLMEKESLQLRRSMGVPAKCLHLEPRPITQLPGTSADIMSWKQSWRWRLDTAVLMNTPLLSAIHHFVWRPRTFSKDNSVGTYGSEHKCWFSVTISTP